MPYDGGIYLRCTGCGEYVVQGEADAHEARCEEEKLTCRICGDRVGPHELREHLLAHTPHAAGLDLEDVRDQFMYASNPAV